MTNDRPARNPKIHRTCTRAYGDLLWRVRSMRVASIGASSRDLQIARDNVAAQLRLHRIVNKPMIAAGDTLRILPRWQDLGDDGHFFRAVEDESGGRVLIRAELGMAINPTHVVHTYMVQRVKH
jgi:hypothetical protein